LTNKYRNQHYSCRNINNINTVFVALVISRIRYAPPAWGVFLSAGQCSKIDAFLTRAHKYGFTNRLFTVNELLTTSAADLYQKVKSSTHNVCTCYYHRRSPLTIH